MISEQIIVIATIKERMMFSERLGILFEELNATSRDISSYAGFDESTLSRLKKGTRIPRQDSPTVQKLANGVYLYAKEKDCLDKLIETVEAQSDGENIEEQLIEWLYVGMNESSYSDNRDENSKNRKLFVTPFRDNLNAVMDMTGTTNSSLSRTLNLDPSAISRFRSGYRIPDKDPELAKRLSNILFEKIERTEKLDELSARMRLYDEPVDRKKFHRWLCDYTDNTALYTRSLERFIGAFENLPKDKTGQFLSVEEAVSKEILEDDSDIYIGQEGLQSAVLRFLGQAIKCGATEFLLYSDQRMDWMSSSKEFHLRWASLMYQCVRHGIHIRIIHNINRGLDEMNEAIISWLPLYMTGMIEPYYVQKPDPGMFAHTVFLCPDKMCISSFCPRGSEKDAVYYFMTDEKALASDYCYFNTLLQKSKMLMRVMDYENEDPSEILYDSGVNVDADILSVESPNKGIKIMIGGGKVNIFRSLPPHLCITMDHPLMYRAFMSYVQSLEK